MENENKLIDLVSNSEYSSWKDGDDFMWVNVTNRSLNVGFSIDEFREFAQNIAQTLSRLEHTPEFPMLELYKTAECFKAVAINKQALKDNSTEDQAYYEGEENAYAEIMYQINDEEHHE